MKPFKIKSEDVKTLQNLNDKELVNLITTTKNTMFFEILLARYERIIYNKILGFVHTEQEAIELSKTFFVVLFSELNHYKGPYKFSNWLYKRAYMLCANHLNKTNKIKEDLLCTSQLDNHLHIEVSDAILCRMNSKKLIKAMSLIEPADKAILMLRYQDDVPAKELALLLEIDASSFQAIFRKAKARIVKTYNQL